MSFGMALSSLEHDERPLLGIRSGALSDRLGSSAANQLGALTLFGDGLSSSWQAQGTSRLSISILVF